MHGKAVVIAVTLAIRENRSKIAYYSHSAPCTPKHGPEPVKVQQHRVAVFAQGRVCAQTLKTYLNPTPQSIILIRTTQVPLSCLGPDSESNVSLIPMGPSSSVQAKTQPNTTPFLKESHSMKA